MARHPHRNTAASAIAIAVLLVAACGSDDDGLPEGLRDIRDAEPADTDPDEDATLGDDEPINDTDDRDQPGEPDELDPEPDSDDDGETFDGVTVPDDALQINDDLDMPPDQQLEYLNFALDAFLYATRALNTGEWDPDELETFYAGDELTRAIEGFEHYEEQGLRQVNEETMLLYMRVDAYEQNQILLHRCVLDGDTDGVVDVETGEYTFQPDDPHWLVAVHLELVERDGPPEPRITEITGPADGISCP